MGLRTLRLVCFDLDGTVMVRPNSLQLLLHLNHAPPDRMLDIDHREETGALHWIAADHERAPYVAGLPVAAIEQHLDEELQAIGNLQDVLDALGNAGVLTALITSGPVEVAEAFARRFPFDHCFGSDFESERGIYTGTIAAHLGSTGKVDSLRRLCSSTGLPLQDCAAVGDGASDLDLFARVGLAIGVNCPPKVARCVSHTVYGDDLRPILQLLLPH